MNREILVSELQKLRQQEYKIRSKIDSIDYAEKKEQRKKIIGKYFILKSSPNDGGRDSGYFYCSEYKNERPYGILITVYGKGVNQSIHIELNWHTFDDWIENGHTIRPSVFNRYLQRAAGQIKKQLSRR